MIRAVVKGGLQCLLGHLPGGSATYRELTRVHMGTQATHVDKLRRVWPGYVAVLADRCGVDFDGLDIWIHEGGWTPFPSLLSYLLTGRGGVVTNHEARVLDRYLARAVTGVLQTELPGALPTERRELVEPLRFCNRATDAIAAVGGSLHEQVDPWALPVPDAAVDLAHSGGALEHYAPETLALFLAECFRVLRPGGVASHILDHRDHLHHADRSWPFLSHWAWPDAAYRLGFDHALGYHNRLTPSQVQAMFEAAGFEPIGELRRLILPQACYVEGSAALRGNPGIARATLPRRRRAVSDLDIRTAAAHYLYRKPR